MFLYLFVKARGDAVLFVISFISGNHIGYANVVVDAAKKKSLHSQPSRIHAVEFKSVSYVSYDELLCSHGNLRFQIP